MKITGIVCEYNPIHNGHLYHIEQTRKNGATHIIAVMSGNFVQRGETAVMDKFTRSALALKGGADLVIEIPAVYCLSSAEFYARGAVSIMNSLGCVDEISFGSECGDIDMLRTAAEAVRSVDRELVTKKMKGGMTYPAALCDVLHEKYSDISAVAASPNNILAIEYLNALKLLESGIRPFTVCRYGAGHDSEYAEGSFASASYIRKNVDQADRFIPEYVMSEYRRCLIDGKLSDMSRLERVILYRLRMADLKELQTVPDVGQGLEYRLMQSASEKTLDGLLERLKTKRYTMARLKRILLNLTIGITKDDLKILPPYARVLAFNERGREILSLCKESRIPVSTSLSRLSASGYEAERFAFLEGRASDVYGLSLEDAGSKEDDFRASVRIKENEL